MTCDEFKAAVARDPDLCTASEMNAIVMHMQGCETCWDYLQTKARQHEEEIRREIGEDEWKKIVAALDVDAALQVGRILTHQANDPEA